MTVHHARPARWLPLVVAVCLALLVAAGCSTAAPASPSPSVATPAGPTVSGAWVRPPMGPDRPAGGYLTITGPTGSADALVGAASPVAGSVEIHETVADASGMAAMHPVDRIEVPAGATVALEPGGYHLMLMGVTGELEPGETVELTLTFETAGDITVKAEIRPG
jgi:hypothetical protein